MNRVLMKTPVMGLKPVFRDVPSELPGNFFLHSCPLYNNLFSGGNNSSLESFLPKSLFLRSSTSSRRAWYCSDSTTVSSLSSADSLPSLNSVSLGLGQMVERADGAKLGGIMQPLVKSGNKVDLELGSQAIDPRPNGTKHSIIAFLNKIVC